MFLVAVVPYPAGFDQSCYRSRATAAVLFALAAAVKPAGRVAVHDHPAALSAAQTPPARPVGPFGRLERVRWPESPVRLGEPARRFETLHREQLV